MDTKNSQFIYQAKIGALGEVIFWKCHEDNTYCFSFFNGDEITPINLSADAAYYVWAFIGCEHPDAAITPQVAMRVGTNCKPNLTTAKKAGCGKPKKRPSLTTKKKAKSK